MGAAQSGTVTRAQLDFYEKEQKANTMTITSSQYRALSIFFTRNCSDAEYTKAMRRLSRAKIAD